MATSRLAYLLDRCLQQQASDPEWTELRELLRDPGNLAEADSLFSEALSGNSVSITVSPGKREEILDSIFKAGPVSKTTRKIHHLRQWRWVAAAIVLLAVGGNYIYHLQRTGRQPAPAATVSLTADVQPGGNKAVLTLGNGQKIVLDGAVNGTLAQQGNAKVLKLNNGQLVYNALHEKPGEQPKEIVYNTLTTPRGGQYRIALPDGTKVWLDAASSVTYPATFAGKDRSVAVTGQVYFEVARDKSRPFQVRVNDVTVEVLGTAFNINAYADEREIRTTLLEGRVKVSAGSRTPLLSPGQQARIGPDGSLKVTGDINADEITAWKNGLFHFEKADIQMVMRQLARWYDVTVSYEGAIPEGNFSGEISRDITLTQLLKGLTQTRVHYRIDNAKHITILP